MDIDVFELAEDCPSKGNIRAVLNDELSRAILRALIQIKRKMTLNLCAQNLGISYSTLHKQLSNAPSLRLLKFLQEQTRIDLSTRITHLTHQGTVTRFPSKITPQLAMIVGSVIADGHLSIRESGHGMKYELVIREEYRLPCEMIASCLKEVFDIECEVKREKKHHLIVANNKVLVSTLRTSLDVPEGMKSHSVDISSIIKNSSRDCKLACLQGLFLFDGGVSRRTGYVDYITISKKLREDIVGLLTDIQLVPDYISGSSDSLGRWKIRFRTHDNLKMCLCLFPAPSEKNLRLLSHVENTPPPQEVLKEKHTNASLSFYDVINAVSLLGPVDQDTVQSYLGKGKTITYEYLRKLQKWNLVACYKRGNVKVYYIPLKQQQENNYYG